MSRMTKAALDILIALRDKNENPRPGPNTDWLVEHGMIEVVDRFVNSPNKHGITEKGLAAIKREGR